MAKASRVATSTQNFTGPPVVSFTASPARMVLKTLNPAYWM